MIRFALFCVLGPLIGFLVFILLGGGFKSHAAESFASLVPSALLAGFIPALVVAALDRMFESWGATSLQRCLLVGFAGYAAAYLLMLENLFETLPLLPFRYDWGLIGAVPAVMCSWISAKVEKSV